MATRSIMTGVLGGVVGLGLGFWLAADSSKPLQAVPPQDGSGAMIASGPVARRMVRVDQLNSVATFQDAVYFLDYSTGQLHAAVPQTRKTIGKTSMLGAFATRNLVSDFRPPQGTTPEFLMTVGEVADPSGWAPLFVYESVTGKVGTYRVVPKGSGPEGALPPRFELLELRQLP